MTKPTTQSSLAPMEKLHLPRPPSVQDMFEFTVQVQPNDTTSSPPTPTFTNGSAPLREDTMMTRKKKNQLMEEKLNLQYSKSMREGCVVSGSGRRTKKWQMLTLGPMKLQPEMDAIRSRQKRRSRSVGGGDHSGERSWNFLNSLSCKAAAVDIVAQASSKSLLF